MYIKGFPLIKFKSEEIINSLQGGKIYLNSLKWFRDYENENGDTIVGDNYEGMLHVNDGELINKETGEHISLNDNLISTTSSNAFVYCMTFISPSIDEFTFSELQKEDLKTFGDTALVILDSEEFINRIKQKAAENGYSLLCNTVQYYDEENDNANIWISLLNNINNIAFWKRKSYSHQQEFRFVISADKCTEDHIELEIGDISDISKVFKTEDVLNFKINRQE